MPRRTKLCDEIETAIVQALDAGAYAVEAATAAGVGESTYYRWLDRGREEQERQDIANGQLDALEHRLEQIGTKPGNRALRAERTRLLKDRKAHQADAKPLPTEEPYRAFREACARACARAEVAAVEVLKRTAEGIWQTDEDGNVVYSTDPDWRAAAWYLERRHPDRWRRRESHDLEHRGSETGPPVQIVADVHGDPAVTHAAHEFLRAARERRGQAVDPAD